MRTAPTDAPLRALAAGCAVPAGEHAGRVAAVFSRAVHVQLDAGRLVVALLGPDGAGAPPVIRLDAEPAVAGFQAGEPLRWRTDAILDGLGRVRVWIPAGSRVSARPIARPDLRRPAVGALWRSLAGALEQRQRAAGTSLRLAALRNGLPSPDAVGERLAEAARALADALRRSDADGTLVACAGLVGLGPGLTPAGDDFTCGLLAACGRTEDWAGGVRSLLGRTTPAGSTLLGCALEGQFADALCALAAALAAGDTRAAGHAMDALCGMGHSSGMDTLTGYLFGLSIPAGAEARTYAA